MIVDVFSDAEAGAHFIDLPFAPPHVDNRCLL
jgi:hypothetical protein